MAEIRVVQTTPFAGQKPGTSGLRKTVTEVSQQNYIENFVQSIFNVLHQVDPVDGKTMVVGGDGRYYNSVAIQKIIKIAAANGVGKLWIGQHGILSTPAVSAIIRQREEGVAMGGLILTASHNPGGPNGDFGIKYNCSNGGPALEEFTDKVYEQTLAISEYRIVDIPDVDLAEIQNREFMIGDRKFEVQIIDSTEDYVALLQTLFNFDELRSFLARPDFRIVYDCMHGVAGPYVRRIFGELLNVSSDQLLNAISREDFGGGHPDPNLVYAHELVEAMGINAPQSPDFPDFGAANDGDADRNMILGKQFFVTPSDSVAVLAANYQYIPYLAGGLKGVARSMPTSAALDEVAKDLGISCYEVPTGWKFFGNLMDNGQLSICGEESFGTGSDHIREKDGVWAVLAWLSVLAGRNRGQSQIVSVKDIVVDHWAKFGRNYYCRYDYENCDATNADQLMKRLNEKMAEFDGETDNFTYTDPVDGVVTRNQGLRFMKPDWRVVYRLSGTGSVGATVRVYYEKVSKENINQSNAEALQDIINWSLDFSDINNVLQRQGPTVIT